MDVFLAVNQIVMTTVFTLKSTTEEDKKKLYDFTFPRVNYHFINSNIPASPVYGVHISQRIRYSRACAQYSEFLNRYLLLTHKLFKRSILSISSILYFKLIWMDAM
jgi:hypothetical protein